MKWFEIVLFVLAGVFVFYIVTEGYFMFGPVWSCEYPEINTYEAHGHQLDPDMAMPFKCRGQRPRNLSWERGCYRQCAEVGLSVYALYFMDNQSFCECDLKS